MADRTSTELDPAEAEASVAGAKSGGGIKAMLPLIITVVLMPAVAWAMTTFVLVPKLQKSLGIVPAAHEKPAEGDESGGHETVAAGEHGGKESGGKEKGSSKETATMTKLLVNVSGTMGSRYLLTSLTLAGNTSDFKAKLEKNDPKLRDIAGTILATKSISDLEKPGARNLVRSELITAFNNVLGGNTVQEIYITEFAIQ